MKKINGNEASQAVEALCKLAKVKESNLLTDRVIKITSKCASIIPSSIKGKFELAPNIVSVTINYEDSILPVLIKLNLTDTFEDSYLCYSEQHESWMLKQSGYGLWPVELSFPKKWWQIF